jgi:hypothetical protein
MAVLPWWGVGELSLNQEAEELEELLLPCRGKLLPEVTVVCH